MAYMYKRARAKPRQLRSTYIRKYCGNVTYPVNKLFPSTLNVITF